GRDERAGIPVAAHYFVMPTWQTPRGFVAIYDRANERPAARFVSMVGSPLPFVSLERPETFLPFDRDEAGARDAARAIAAFLMRPPG
ncbi:MAG: hypothetical protein IAI48_14755, partial [Candidatus Eremiobacteraeota bacterium]|nr:hypothetical protein [Candidatus Eremiobacteraeota bacterium]